MRSFDVSAQIGKSSSVVLPKHSPQRRCTTRASSKSCALCSRTRPADAMGHGVCARTYSLDDALDWVRCRSWSRRSRVTTATCDGRPPNWSCASAETNRDAISNQLIAIARDGNLNARKMALYCLRDVGGPIEDLLSVAEHCCGENHSLLKMAALSLLARLENGSHQAAALAIRLLEHDPDAGVRRCAAVALGHIDDRSPRVVEALAQLAKQEDDIYMKRAAQAALARLGANACGNP